MTRDFQELTVWQKAHELTLLVYRHTGGFPKDKRYGLSSQIRRSWSSISANIAEGSGRSGYAELGRFLQIGMASPSEFGYRLLLVRDLDFLDSRTHDSLTNRATGVKHMVTSFIRNLTANRGMLIPDADR